MLQRITTVAIMIAAATLIGCQSSPSANSAKTQPVDILDTLAGQDAGLQGPEVYVFTSQAQLEASGSKTLAKEGFNFDDISLVVISGGEQPTGGYWVNIDGIQIGGKTLYVQGTFNAPGEGAVTTQALTHPYQAAIINKVGDVYINSDVRSVAGQPLPE